MAEHHHPRHEDDGPLPDPVAVGHETSDAQAAPIIRFLVFLAVFSIGVAVLMVAFHNYLERREAAEKAGRYPVAAGRERPLPPPPRLQTEPFENIKELRADQRKLLDRYEYVDRANGQVRIPIERAMDLVAERGLPHRAPGDGSGGRARPDVPPDTRTPGAAAGTQQPAAAPQTPASESGAAAPKPGRQPQR